MESSDPLVRAASDSSSAGMAHSWVPTACIVASGVGGGTARSWASDACTAEVCYEVLVAAEGIRRGFTLDIGWRESKGCGTQKPSYLVDLLLRRRLVVLMGTDIFPLRCF